MMRYDQFYAGGRFHPADGGRSSTVINPSTERPCGEVVFCSKENADLAVKAARQGYEVWRESSIADRQRALERLRAELQARASDIVSSLAAEIGCPVWLGDLMQVPMPLKGIEHAIEALPNITWQEQIGNGLVEKVPYGVVLAITPWNFPVHQIVGKVAAALAAGCSVVLKPSEFAPGAAMAFMEAVHGAGLPSGVINMVWGDADLGQYLVSHAQVDRISFTGSTGVGQRIMVDAAARLVPLTLELGGKSAAVMLDDADFEAAIPVAVRMGLANSGQTCVSQSRLIVPKSRAQEVIERFKTAAEQWLIGDPQQPETRLGPLANMRQFEHVNNMIARARQEGAKEVLAGKWPGGQGYFVLPRLFVDVHPDMEIAQREIFGPVVGMMTYETLDEAVELANASSFGLSGAVWSADTERATHFGRRMRTGQIIVNGAQQNLATAFGGWGMSGFGRENGRFGIEDMLNLRSLHGVAMNMEKQ